MKKNNKKTPTKESFESLSNDMIWHGRKRTTGFIRRSLTAWTSVGLTLLSAGIASAAAIQGSTELEGLQQAETSLAHQYTFTGSTTTEALKDKEGTNNLSAITGNGPVTVADTTLTLSGGNVAGSTMAYPGSFALEFLVRPSGLTSDYGQFFSTTTGGNRYYIMQKNDSFVVRFGSGASIINLFTGIQAGSAYYIALNFNYIDPTPLSGDDAKFLVDAWVGEAIQNGSGNLLQVFSSKEFALDDTIAAPFNSYVRNGCFVNNVASSVWTGDLDSIAWYNSTLAESTVDAHYAPLAVPEPSVFGLVGASLAVLGILRRRRACQ